MPRHKKMSTEQLDQQIIRIQRSTRTTFSAFIPLHHWLRNHNRWYYNWHLNKHTDVIHIGILIGFAVISLPLLAQNINNPFVVDADVVQNSSNHTWTDNFTNNNGISNQSGIVVSNGISLAAPSYDLALTANGGTGSSIGCLSEYNSSAGSCFYAFDGDDTTRWLTFWTQTTAIGNGHTYQYAARRLASPTTTFNTIKLVWLSGGRGVDYSFWTCTTSCNSESNYTQLLAITGNTNLTPTYTFNPTSAEQIELRVSNIESSSRAALATFNVIQAAPLGTFTSTVIDAGNWSKWGNLTTTATVPADGSLTISTRTGNTGTVDSTWSDWQAVTNNVIASPGGRYLQYKATLTVPDSRESLTLNSVAIAYQPDITPPTLTISAPAATHDGSVVVSGTVTDNLSGVNKVVVSGYGSPITASITGTTWSATFADIPEENYQFQAIATDVAGNQIAQTTSTKVDRTKPTLSINAPAYSTEGSVLVNGFYNDDRSGLDKITVRGSGNDGVVAGLDGASWMVTYSNVPEGTYQYSAIALDKAGNEQQIQAANTTTVDKTAPSLQINAPGEIQSADATVTGTVSDSLSGLANFTINNQPITINSDGSFQQTYSDLANGANSFAAVATDKAGNTTQQQFGIVSKQLLSTKTGSTGNLSNQKNITILDQDGKSIEVAKNELSRIAQYGKGQKPADASVIATIQLGLKTVGLFQSDVTGYFGAVTRNAVRAFQVQSGLKATGQADIRTVARLQNLRISDQRYIQLLSKNQFGYTETELTDALHYQLKTDVVIFNSYSEEVKFAQKKLYLLGYYNAPTYGYLNVTTQRAIKSYQKDRGIPTTGNLDAATRDSLNKLDQ